jgi:hypothetical protein
MPNDNVNDKCNCFTDEDGVVELVLVLALARGEVGRNVANNIRGKRSLKSAYELRA